MSGEISFVGKPQRIPDTPFALFRLSEAPPPDWARHWSSTFGRIEGDVLVVAVPEGYPKVFLDTLKLHLKSVNAFADAVRKIRGEQDIDRALEDF